MRVLKVIMFLVGVCIVLVGLALIVSVRIDELQSDGSTVGPEGWVAIIESIARLWGQVVGGVGPQYATGVTVLLIGIVVMSVPIALPRPAEG
jgi:hypothetical protein